MTTQLSRNYISYQETIFEIATANLASYHTWIGTNFSRHQNKLSTIKEKSATLSAKTEQPKVGEYLLHL